MLFLFMKCWFLFPAGSLPVTVFRPKLILAMGRWIEDDGCLVVVRREIPDLRNGCIHLLMPTDDIFSLA